MSDLIDRQAAMKIRFSSGYDHDGILFIPYRDVEEHLKKLPSVQPRKGKWIEHDDYLGDVFYVCSACEEPFVLIDGTPEDNLYNFCPNCGADMRPQAEEPTINPCRGCPDYIAPDGCRSSGGCADMREGDSE